MMTQEVKDIYETWLLKETGFLPEQAIDALEEKDKHYAVAIGQLSNRIEELEKLATQRGERMQMMREWMASQAFVVPSKEWMDYWDHFIAYRPEAADWFDNGLC